MKNNKKLRTWPLLHLKKHLHRPGFYLLSAFCLFLLYIFMQVVFPTSERMTYGILARNVENLPLILEKLEDDSDIYTYVLFDDREALNTEVRSGRLDCGFVLDERLNAITDLTKMDRCVDYICSTSTTKGVFLKEKMFAAVYRMVLKQLLLSYANDGVSFKNPSPEIADVLMAAWQKYLSGQETLQVVFEEANVSVGNTEESFGSLVVTRSGLAAKGLALCGMVIFAFAIVFARTRFGTESRQMASALRGRERILWQLLEILMPVLAITVLVIIAYLFILASQGELTGAAGLKYSLAFILYGFVCTVWAGIYSRPFRSEGVYLCSIVCVLLLSIITCRSFINIQNLVPILKISRYFFPVNYLIMLR